MLFVLSVEMTAFARWQHLADRAPPANHCARWECRLDEAASAESSARTCTRIRSPRAEAPISRGKLVDMKAARQCARHSRVARCALTAVGVLVISTGSRDRGRSLGRPTPRPGVTVVEGEPSLRLPLGASLRTCSFCVLRGCLSRNRESIAPCRLSPAHRPPDRTGSSSWLLPRDDGAPAPSRDAAVVGMTI